jgi:hypothetical protein
MAIELSNIIFTDQDDVVPVSGVEQIVNTGIANTVAGNDIITGTGYIGIENRGTLNTDDGNDLIAGVGQSAGIRSVSGTINTGDGDDIITGTSSLDNLDNSLEGRDGILTYYSTLDTGKGNDIITGSGGPYCSGISNFGSTFNTDDGNDIIIGTGGLSRSGIYNEGVMDTGNGQDIIAGINTGSGSYGGGIYNRKDIKTGEGKDIITGNGDLLGIENDGTINTGNGADLIIGRGGYLEDGFYFGAGILNNGTINTGDGTDSIIAEGGFFGSGSVFLENGKDYLKGFGMGNFSGGNGQDTLELTSGTYTIEISETGVNFTQTNSNVFGNTSITMITSEFEKLIVGSTTYDFTSLTEGQTIIIA